MSAAIFYPGFVGKFEGTHHCSCRSKPNLLSVGSYPAILLAQRYPIERVIFGIVLLWGMSLTER